MGLSLFPGIALKHHAIEDETAGNGICPLRFSNSNRESVMGLAEYMIVAQGDEWGVLHDGSVNNRYATKERAKNPARSCIHCGIESPTWGDPIRRFPVNASPTPDIIRSTGV